MDSRYGVVTCVPSLDTPSRLKGIETSGFGNVCNPFNTLDTPSRLKGIETFPFLPRRHSDQCFGYTFPFEGN